MKNSYLTKILFITALLALLIPLALPATSISVSGTINSDANWTEVDTVRITGDVDINANVTVTIGAGTVVYFMGLYDMFVRGRLIAIGTEDDMITFTAHNQTQGWLRLEFVSVNNPALRCELQYCIFEYSKGSNVSGAVYLNQSNEVRIADCIFRYNVKYFAGTGISLSLNSTITIENCVFHNNQTSGWGGMIHLRTNSVVKNCLFFANTGGPSSAMGILANGCNPTIINSTIVAGNYAAVSVIEGANPVFRNSILRNNRGPIVNFTNTSVNNPDFYFCNVRGGLNGILSEANDQQGGYDGEYQNCIDADPLFVGSGDHPYDLQIGSPCINAGDPSTSVADIGNYDLAGKDRIRNGRVDIGAYEGLIPPDNFVGNCLKFDGVNDYVSGSGIDTSLSAFTLEAWVYHNTLPAGAIQRYVTISPEVAVLRYDGTSYGGERSLHFYFKRTNRT
ncbi:MAG: right-handed parallel beta-helix repeat-containing protein [Candidatus Cloacimonetes bacterium]|nr:right-handed parallel beta-helix repeat-containing protein [Candidatus Cloacimonadota bacterium]